MRAESLPKEESACRKGGGRDVFSPPAGSEKGGFFWRVYALLRQVPCGKVVTYGQIAAMLGAPRMARQVGYALHVNPEPGVIPCHRVVNRFGGLSPAFAFGGDNQQRILLEGEGVTFLEDGRVDMKKHMWYGETLR